MKVLYAASHYHNSGIQLSRFIDAVQDTDHLIKVAAYKSSSPKGQSIDWTLDALLNMVHPQKLSLDGDNVVMYMEQVKDWKPDLIISDLEYFTSMIANELSIPVWQYSSSMINFAIQRNEKNLLGLNKNFAQVVKRDYTNQKMTNIIDNSDRNLVCSHFGDVEKPLHLYDNFQWVRPYHQVSKYHVPCQHFLTAALVGKSKHVIDTLKKQRDCVVFTERNQESYQDVAIKDVGMTEEYYCNLKNSVFFACQGYASFLADGFYNGKHSLIFPDYEDEEAIISSQLSQSLGTGTIVSGLDFASQLIPLGTHPQQNTKHLHEYLEEA